MQYSTSKIVAPHRKVRSFDLSEHALINKTPRKKWGGVRNTKASRNLVSIAIVIPKPGKGFEFKGVVRSFQETLEEVRAAGFTAYRQGSGRLTKKGEVNRVISLV